MKTQTLTLQTIRSAVIILFFSLFTIGCQKGEMGPGGISSDNSDKKFKPNNDYSAVNLVSDVDEYGPVFIDTNLVNAWGIAFGPTGGIWVSAAEKGLSTIYDKNGNTLRPPVNIPFNGEPNGGNPTGQVFNSTSGFIIPSTGQASKFIFATENGTIAAWSGGNNAVIVADRSSSEAVYKGLELASDGGAWFLYATDFHNAKVDVFDQNFNYVSSKPFVDPNMPAGYAPFNIKLAGSMLVVTYAKQLGPDNEDDEKGPGNGYVDIYRTNGSLVKRLASQGALNSPWGIAVLKENNGVGNDGMDGNDDIDFEGDHHGDHHDDGDRREEGHHHTLLIGNFGDGHINAYSDDGTYLGPLMSNGAPLEIEGLWAISYAPGHNSAYMDVRSRLYFTAGPDDEEHGIFGYIAK